MPLTLAQMLALFNDNTSGDISAEDARDVITALYDWIPASEKHLVGRLPGETAHASDDFFSAYSGYTEVNPAGTATWTKSAFGLSVVYAGQAANDLGVTLKAVPAGPPLTIETCYVNMAISTSGIGLVFTDGTVTTSNCIGVGFLADGPNLYAVEGTITSASPTNQSFTRTNWQMGRTYFRLVWASANTFAWAFSPDGVNWTDHGGADVPETITPTHMGFWSSAWGSATTHAGAFHYLRVYEADLSL